MYAKDIRANIEEALLGCKLLKVPIAKLERTKLTKVLKTADAHDDIIVNLEEDEYPRMNMDMASKKWLDLATTMEWACTDFLILIGGTGEMFKPAKTFKSLAEEIKIEDVPENCPILLDTDWFVKHTEVFSKKRSLSDAGWSETSVMIQQPKKPEPAKDSEEASKPFGEQGIQEPDLNRTFEEFRLQAQQMLEEERQKIEALKTHYEERIRRMNEHQDYVATTTESREKQHEERVGQLEHQLRQKDHERILINQDLTELRNQVQDFEGEKRQLQEEMARLGELIQSQNAVKTEAMEPSAINNTLEMESIHSDQDEAPFHSSPKRINEISKGVPTTLGKLGMTVFNPAKQTKIEYLSKFVMLVEDWSTGENFKQIKQLIYQAFAEDRNFRIHDLSTDDKSSLQKLAHAIIKQDDGDTIDLMKSFESEQLRHGEMHLNYLHRMNVLYEFAINNSDANWKSNHLHAQKIYNKIDNSLPSSARSKFRELMMEARKQSDMTVDKIRTSLETVLMIFKDELKSAMGSQRHIVPTVDAIQSKSRRFPSRTKEVICWKCGSSGHMKRFCPQKGNNREPKTSGRKEKVQCFSCQGFGHISNRCPNKQRGQNKWNRENKDQ